MSDGPPISNLPHPFDASERKKPKPKCDYCDAVALLDVRGPRCRPGRRWTCKEHHARAVSELHVDGTDPDEISERAAAILGMVPSLGRMGTPDGSVEK